MTIGSQKDIDGLTEIGKIVALTIHEMKLRARIGMTTKELDEIGEWFLTSRGAVSAPKTTKSFPGHTCISINHEVAHGIPGNRSAGCFKILPVYNKHDKRVLKEGLVIAIAPFLSTGADYVVEQSDGWTLCLPDSGFAAQHEHTIIITKNQPIIVTVA